MGALTDKVALITGGSPGIGFATAQQLFAADGAYVFITARRQEELDQAVSTIGKNITGIVILPSKFAIKTRKASAQR